LDTGVLGYIGIVQHKEHSPEVLSIPLGTPCIYSTNIHTEYFKHAAQSQFFSLQNAIYFIMLPCLVPVLFASYLRSVLKFKCNIPAPKG